MDSDDAPLDLGGEPGRVEEVIAEWAMFLGRGRAGLADGTGEYVPRRIKAAAGKLRALPSDRLRKLVDFGFLSDDARLAAEWLLYVRAIGKENTGAADVGPVAAPPADQASPAGDAASQVVLPLDYRPPAPRGTSSGRFWTLFSVGALVGILSVGLRADGGGTWVALISVLFVGLLLAAGRVHRRVRNPMVPLVAGLLTPLLFWLAFLLGAAMRSWM